MRDLTQVMRPPQSIVKENEIEQVSEKERVFMQFTSEGGDREVFAEIVLEEQKPLPEPVPWVFRANESLGGWMGMKSGEIQSTSSCEKLDELEEIEVDSKEEFSLCRTISQIVVWLSGFGLAGAWIYQYIGTQMRQYPVQGILAFELAFLILYLATLGFFVCMFAFRLTFPFMIRLSNYATNHYKSIRRVFAIIAVLGLWFICVLWIFILPLVPVIGGVIAGKAS